MNIQGYLLAGVLAVAATANAHDDDAAKSRAPLKLGKVSFPTTCNRSVQPTFERGVALLHSFWFEEAEKAFRDVLAHNPSCAIANWGIAALRIGNTFVGGARPPDAQVATEAIERGRAIGAKSERERAYIEAIAAYWNQFRDRSHAERMKSIAESFGALAVKFPKDDEAQIFHAIYLTATQLPTDKTFGPTLQAAAILERQLARHPEHPGVAHYLIHSYDYPPIAEKGLSAARRYAKIAPSAPHALHMPSHIFTRVGAWKESAETNRRSADTSLKEQAPNDQLHALDYYVYANLQMARDKDAMAGIEEARAVTKLDAGVRTAWYALAAMPARYAVERNAWKEAAALNVQQTQFSYATAMSLYAKALGAARTEDVAGAEALAGQLGDIEQQLRTAKDAYWSTEVQVQKLGAQAWAAYAGGKKDQALALMRQSADLEDTSEKSAVSPGRLVPARELLGDMLMENGNATEALAEYERAQVRDPNRLRALYGAGLAAAQAGDKQKARLYFGRVAALAGTSDARPELRKVREYLAAN